jgi:hypothetical protein
VALPVAARIPVGQAYLGCVLLVVLAAVLVGGTLFGGEAVESELGARH